jgi:hypothetical protein
MKRIVVVAALILLTVAGRATFSQSLPADSFSGLRARSIGPAVTSGRVMTIAVDPSNSAVFYIGAASGGVWKTVNGGATWQPVFDTQGSYSIGWITIDATRPNIVWVGTGERNAQRSVAYGDGVYKSEDGGRSWANVGLKTSEHIGRIVIDPEDSDTVYVAAQGRCGPRAATAGSSRRPTAAGPGPRFSRSRSTPASPTWSSIRATRR